MTAEPQQPTPRPLWRKPVVWVGFILSGLAMGTFIALFDLGQVSRSLMRADPGWMGLASAAFLISFLARSLRWKLLITPMKTLPFGQVRDVLWTGFMVNSLLPARAGEIARPLILWKVAGTSRRGGLASVGVERIFDGLVLVSLISLLAYLFEVPRWARNMGHITTAVLVERCDEHLPAVVLADDLGEQFREPHEIFAVPGPILAHHIYVYQVLVHHSSPNRLVRQLYSAYSVSVM